MFSRALPITSALLALVASSPLYAQSETATEEAVILPTFTVESETVDRYRAAEAVSAIRVRTQLIETPNSISVMTSDFLGDVKPVRLVDATRYLAGIQDGTFSNFLDTQIIRGFVSQGRTVDNFRDITVYNFDEALIERVEVSKGPNALMAPDANPGGSLNIVTKSPQFTRNRSLSTLVGEYDAQKVSLDMTDKIDARGRFAYRLIGSYQDSRRYWSADARIRKTIFAPQFAWRINDTTDLVVKYYKMDSILGREPLLILDPSISQRGQKPIIGPEFSTKNWNGVPHWNRLHYQGQALNFQLSTSLNSHITTRLAGQWQRSDEKGAQAFVFGTSMVGRYNPYSGFATPNETWALLDSTLPHDATTNPYVPTFNAFYDPSNIPQFTERIDDDVIEQSTLQNDWVFSFDLPHSIKSQTVIGWAYSTGDSRNIRSDGSVDPINLFDLANLNNTPTWNTFTKQERMRENESTQFYINQRLTFLQDRLALSGGVLRYKTETRSTDLLLGTPWSVLDDSKDMFQGSVLYRVTPAASVYYSYSTNAQPAVVNNISLWREGTQHEYGVKTEFFNRRLAINAAYFEISQSNASIANPEYMLDNTQSPFFLVDFENYGFELEMTGAITRNLSIMGAFTHLKMRDPLGRHVVSVSERLISGLVNYHFSEGRLDGLALNIGVSHTGEQAGDTPAVDVTPLGVITQPSWFVPSHTTWTGGASYTWSRYSLSLTVDNLTNKKGYIKTGGGRNSVYGISLARPITYRLSATVKF